MYVMEHSDERLLPEGARELCRRAAGGSRAAPLCARSKGSSGQAAADRSRLLLSGYSRRLDSGSRRAWSPRGRATSIVLPVLVRRPREGGRRARLHRRVHAVATGVPRAAHRQHRRRAEHHRSDDAHRGPAQAVAAARRRAAGAAGASCSRPTTSWRTRRSCSPSRTRRSSARTRKSSWRAARWKRRPRSWRSPRATSPSSWPTCRTSCARRSTAS